ncbi:response regulator [Paenibacillus whitsoniae]|uniref:Response regulator n=1 Tax=Paenibacillus whitsoniae TaxID=2496558 RepID=A0A3S0ALM0_9BACL|nr:response regulator [Paenibacillus whitsoniae]RTE05749.1 response regulator [Paenibacillus whitsoniae]
MLKLLMVDDEQWIRERFSERIPWSEAGFTFLGAASGAEEAIGMIERNMPHVLLTDITMPNMNGLELAAYVRRRWPRIRIVILTAYGEFEYARQAIELGVDNYLIKLAQTPAQILDACRKVAESIEQEMDVDQKLAMRLELEREKEWQRKRQWTEYVLENEGKGDQRLLPEDWFGSLHTASYLVDFTLGWRLHPEFEQAAHQTEAIMLFQRQLAEELERKMDSELGDGCKLTLLPLRQMRLGLLVSSMQPMNAFYLKKIAMIALDTLKAHALAHTYLHIGDLRDLDKRPLDEKQLGQMLREGLDRLAAYFYKSDTSMIGKQAVPLRRLDSDISREWIANMVKALQRGNVEAFRESASLMIGWTEAPIHPADLLRITKQIFQPELVQLPDAVIVRLSEIDQLETWEEFCGWWTDTMNAINDWLKERFLPPTAFRKEIQIMCRYIREHYMEDMQVAELAKLVHMHPSYVGQMFRQEVGENLSDYVNRVRMEKASELLENTTMKIYEVSSAVGISDYRYFCKVFKTYTGFTPTQFKSKHS